MNEFPEITITKGDLVQIVQDAQKIIIPEPYTSDLNGDEIRAAQVIQALFSYVNTYGVRAELRTVRGSINLAEEWSQL